MSTFTDRPNTALLVIDVQNGVVGEAHDRDAVVGNVATLVEKARAGDTPVVWVQHSGDDLPQGSEPWQYVPELHGDRAGGAQAVRRLVRGHRPGGRAGRGAASAASWSPGAQTDECIRSTIHGPSPGGTTSRW